MATSNFSKETMTAFTLGAATAGLVFMLANRKLNANRARSAALASGVTRIDPPNPNWTPGVKQNMPFTTTKMVGIDPSKIKSSYPLMISAYVPRPIALVSSESLSGVGNVAPFSFSGVAGFDPPTISISVVRQGGECKDTHKNIVETGEFVVNIISDWFVNAANYTSMQALSEENEMDIAGLSPVPSSIVKPPRVGESAMQFECKLKDSVDITNDKGVITATVFFGEVVMFHVHEEVLDISLGSDKPQVKLEGYRPVSRLGGNTYGLTTEVFDITRPPRPKEGFPQKK